MYSIEFKDDDQSISVYNLFDDAINEAKYLLQVYYHNGMTENAKKLQVVNLSTGKVVWNA